MKFNTHIPKALLPYYTSELNAAKEAMKIKNYSLAWQHLERAHILGQRYPVPHSEVHWKMLLFGIQIKSVKEVIGQIPRLLVGGVKSFVGTIPVGNPGGANVPPMRPFPIEEDLASIFAKAGVQ